MSYTLQDGFELHGIQMAPLLLGSMIIDGTGLSAFRTTDAFAGIKKLDGYLLVWYGDVVKNLLVLKLLETEYCVFTIEFIGKSIEAEEHCVITRSLKFYQTSVLTVKAHTMIISR